MFQSAYFGDYDDDNDDQTDEAELVRQGQHFCLTNYCKTDESAKGCHDGTWDAVEDCEPVCAPPCQVTIL